MVTKNELIFIVLCFLSACSSTKETTFKHSVPWLVERGLTIKEIDGDRQVGKCKGSWKIPEILGLKNLKLQTQINNYFKKFTPKLCHSKSKKKRTITLIVKPERIINDFLILKISHSEIHSDSNLHQDDYCQVLDLNTGKPVSFDSQIQSEGVNFVESLILDQIWDGDTDAQAEYNNSIDINEGEKLKITTRQICPSDQGLTLLFPTYEIAPAAFGNPEIRVKKEDWTKILKQNDETNKIFEFSTAD